MAYTFILGGGLGCLGARYCSSRITVVHKLLDLCFPFSFFLCFSHFSPCIYISAQYISFLYYIAIHFNRVRWSLGRGNKNAQLWWVPWCQVLRSGMIVVSTQERKKQPAEPLSSAYRCATDAVLMDCGRHMKSSTFASFKEGEYE